MAHLEESKKAFYGSVYPSLPNEWDVDEVFEHLGELSSESRTALLEHVGAIWPVSHSLCFTYLIEGAKAVDQLPHRLLPEWVRQILGAYEKSGLPGARIFMADVDRFFLAPLRGESGMIFEEMSLLMSTYIQGVSGRLFELAAADQPSTDTQTIYLPRVIDVCAEKTDNSLLYKLLVSLQWVNSVSRVYERVADLEEAAKRRFLTICEEDHAADLLAALQFTVSFRILSQKLPGLVRRVSPLCLKLINEIAPGPDAIDGKQQALQTLLLRAVEGKEGDTRTPFHLRGDVPAINGEEGDCLSPDLFYKLFAVYTGLPGTCSLNAAAMLLGRLDFRQAEVAIHQRREADKQQFLMIAAAFLEKTGAPRSENEAGGGGSTEKNDDGMLLLLKGIQQKEKNNPAPAPNIHNEGAELPEELTEAIARIKEDLGHVPESYVQAAAGISGGGVTREGNVGEAMDDVPPATLPFDLYDEWDFRRGGYRDNWCKLYEKKLHPVRSGFVEATKKKYQAQLFRLRRQFEMLRTQSRYVGRQRQGDDIDLDALTDALGDSRAGLPPSDRLFVRLLRDERDISALFLIDMSNSTEGWVGIAVKEALVLLAESLEVVGDCYGIYGFSGMRRSRSELYCIKAPDELYDKQVQQRIAAIGPREYTRMGPPIRHLTKQLLGMQSKVRLLIVISDGKPEDYDDYKGEYAIEDTRKALLEAKGNGMYTFCITIDKSAHEYLGHMFGRKNYIFINNVSTLPTRMAEMYRLLTS